MTSKGRLFGGVGAGLGFLVLALYLVLILGEGDDTLLQVGPWALAMATASAAAAVGVATSRHRLVSLSGVLFMVIGVPAIFSVGLPLMVAGLLCLLASSYRTRPLGNARLE